MYQSQFKLNVSMLGKKQKCPRQSQHLLNYPPINYSLTDEDLRKMQADLKRRKDEVERKNRQLIEANGGTLNELIERLAKKQFALLTMQCNYPLSEEEAQMIHKAFEKEDMQGDLPSILQIAQRQREEVELQARSEQLKIEIENLAKRIEQTEKRRDQLMVWEQMSDGLIRLYCRIRPLKQGEQAACCSVVNKNPNNLVATITQILSQSANQVRVQFEFDRLFKAETSQAQVFCAFQPSIEVAIRNGKMPLCLFAYGQTGSGKTHTVFGVKNSQEEGIGYRLVRKLVEFFKKSKQEYRITIGAEEITKDGRKDLLKGGQKLKKGESQRFEEIRTQEQGIKLVSHCQTKRQTKKTGLNQTSSRSHLILTFKTWSKNVQGTISLVDLAGSEDSRKLREEKKEMSKPKLEMKKSEKSRPKYEEEKKKREKSKPKYEEEEKKKREKSRPKNQEEEKKQAEEERILAEESKFINQSLSALKTRISELNSGKVITRSSEPLIQALDQYLRPGSMTTTIVAISPNQFDQTHRSMDFASVAKGKRPETKNNKNILQ